MKLNTLTKELSKHMSTIKNFVKKYPWQIILVLAIIIKLYLVYWGYFTYHYLVPPGDDTVNHYWMIKESLGLGFKSLISQYPKGFHWFVILLAKIFNKDYLYILTYWTPFLIILPTVSIYYLLRQFFSAKTGVLTVLILLLASNFPTMAFVDGNYPDMLAYGFLTPLFFAFLFKYYKNKEYKNLIISTIILIIIFLTHHLTTVIVLSILFLLIIALWFRRFLKLKKISVKDIFFLAGLFIAIVFAYGLLSYLYNGLVSEFIGGLFGKTATINNTYFNKPLGMGEYKEVIGGFMWFLGIFSLVYLFLTGNHSQKLKYLIIIWFLVLFILSRFPNVSIPVRFARELAIPLTFSLAFLFNDIFDLQILTSKIKKIIAYGLFFIILVFNSQFYIGVGSLPDSFTDQVWYWPVDQEKIDFLAKDYPGRTVVINKNANPYTIVKIKNPAIYFSFTDQQLENIKKYNNIDKYSNLDQEIIKNKYQETIKELKNNYKNDILLISEKSKGNSNEETYPCFQGYKIYNDMLKEISSEKKPIKKFSDGSTIIDMSK